MCFQGFAHHRCGCITLFEEECDLATALEGVPFYSKVACPNYHIARRETDIDCGKGGLYCANTPDAAYLDYVHNVKLKAEAQIASTDQYINEEIHPLRQGFLKTIEERCGGDMAKMKQVYMNQPVCQQVDQRWAALLQKKRVYAAGLAQANHILRYARDFYMLQRQAYGSALGNKQPLPDVLKNLQIASAGPTPQLNHPLLAPSVQPAYHVGPSNLQVPRSNAQLPSMVSTPSHQQPSTVPNADQSDPFGSTKTRGKSKPKQRQPSLQSNDSIESPRKRKGSIKKAATEDSPDDPSPNLRRSTRVRGKKVNYNEEASESLPSRTPSPEKSDASSYSPSKSDLVSDRVGVKPAHRSSSLRDMIGEYKKQAGMAATPTRNPSLRTQTSGGSLQNFGVQDGVPQIRVDSPTRSNTPDTDILHPDDPRHDGGFQAPMQLNGGNNSYAQPGIRLPNGNPDPAVLAFQIAHQNTRVGGTTTSNASYGSTPASGASYGSTPGQMAPPPNPMDPTYQLNPSPPDTMGDPRKRQMPASSPAIGSNKRVQLTYPWANNSYSSNMPTMTASSPPRMSRQDSGMSISMPPPPLPAMYQTFKPSGLSQVSPMTDTFPPTATTNASLQDTTSANNASYALPDEGDTGMPDEDWTLFSDGSKF